MNLTARQISNAYDRAAKLAWDQTQVSQKAMFAATPSQLTAERGAACSAAGFAAQALAKLQNGDYEGFLAGMRLAGGFAIEASDVYYSRKMA